MAFLKNSNRHDSWLQFYNLHRDLLDEIGLAQAIIYGEHRFRALLRDGFVTGCGVAANLEELSEDQWLALQRFAAVFFHECESYAPLDLFPAFKQKVERRCNVETK